MIIFLFHWIVTEVQSDHLDYTDCFLASRAGAHATAVWTAKTFIFFRVEEFDALGAESSIAGEFVIISFVVVVERKDVLFCWLIKEISF